MIKQILDRVYQLKDAPKEALRDVLVRWLGQFYQELEGLGQTADAIGFGDQLAQFWAEARGPAEPLGGSCGVSVSKETKGSIHWKCTPGVDVFYPPRELVLGTGRSLHCCTWGQRTLWLVYNGFLIKEIRLQVDFLDEKTM